MLMVLSNTIILQSSGNIENSDISRFMALWPNKKKWLRAATLFARISTIRSLKI